MGTRYEKCEIKVSIEEGRGGGESELEEVRSKSMKSSGNHYS